MAQILLFDERQQVLVIGIHKCAQPSGAIGFPAWFRGLLIQQIVDDQGAGEYGYHTHGEWHKLKSNNITF